MTISPLAPVLAVTVVEDEPMAQDVLVRAARSWQFSCQAASTAEQALDLLQRNLTPVVVTDLRMPGRGGLWLIREIRRRWPEVGIIVLTAGHDPESTNECLRAGAHHYFFKPIKLDEFRHVLETTWRTYLEDQQKSQQRTALEEAVRRRTGRVRRTYLSAITSLARTMEERDPYTAGHSRRVRNYVMELARAIGLERKQRRLLSLAAQLHDIGKVAVPDAILHKPGALTEEEFAVVREHPAVGERILAPVVQPHRPRRHPRAPRTTKRHRLPGQIARQPDPAARPADRDPGLLRRPDHVSSLPSRLAGGGRPGHPPRRLGNSVRA